MCCLHSYHTFNTIVSSLDDFVCAQKLSQPLSDVITAAVLHRVFIFDDLVHVPERASQSASEEVSEWVSK